MKCTVQPRYGPTGPSTRLSSACESLDGQNAQDHSAPPAGQCVQVPHLRPDEPCGSEFSDMVVKRPGLQAGQLGQCFVRGLAGQQLTEYSEPLLMGDGGQ